MTVAKNCFFALAPQNRIRGRCRIRLAFGGTANVVIIREGCFAALKTTVKILILRDFATGTFARQFALGL